MEIVGGVGQTPGRRRLEVGVAEQGQRPDRGRAVTIAGLREIAGPQLYRANAFRILGLPTDADRRTVRQRQRQVIPALEAGADVDLGHDLPVRLEDARTAFERLLNSPHRRLIDEVFWLWGDESEACGCSRKMHRDHDAAVRAHSAALDLETKGAAPSDDELEELWSDAARLWEKLLRRPAFWDHVRSRIAAVDERQLDESVVDVLRDEVPLTLARPLVELAVAASEGKSRLADRARSWPGVPARVVDEQLEDAAAHLYDAVRAAMNDVQPGLDGGKAKKAAQAIYDKAIPNLRRLEALVPPDRHRRTATVRNEVGVALNNCATALIDELGHGADKQGRKWLNKAEELALDPQTLETIRTNRATLDEVVRQVESIRSMTDELVAAGRAEVARWMLRDYRRRASGTPLVKEIDRLLAGLPEQDSGAHDPVFGDLVTPEPERPALPRPAVRRRRSFGDRVAGFLARFGYTSAPAALAEVVTIGAIFALAFWFWPSDPAPPGPTTARLFQEVISDNAPPGQCIATEQGWDGDKAAVPVVPCDQPHWGEVLGYAPLTPVPARYPGDDQVNALTEFKCGLMLAERGLPTDQYATTGVKADPASWNDDGRNYENYATCVVHRTDDQPMPKEVLTDPAPRVADPAVRMSVFQRRIWQNAPVGSCLRSKEEFDASIHDVSVIECERPHWAEILGYPVLYEHSTPWPGDDVVYGAADAACRKLAEDETLPPEFTYDFTYPAGSVWQDPESQIYATCYAVRVDGQPSTGAV